MQYYTIATEIGTAAASNAFLTGTKVNITTFIVGDGGGIEYAPTPDMTELRNEVWRGVVSHAEIDPDSPNVINYTALLPSTVGGFVMREMGIVDDQGRLIGIGNMASTPKIRFDQGISDEIELTFSLTISSPEAMEWKVDPTVILATKADIAAHNLSVESHPDIWDELSDINTQLSNKADKGLLPEYNLQPVPADWTPGWSTYYKDDFGVVRVHVSLNYTGTDDASSGKKQLVLGVLPEGYRPRYTVEIGGHFRIAGETEVQTVYGGIGNDGRVFLWAPGAGIKANMRVCAMGYFIAAH